VNMERVDIYIWMLNSAQLLGTLRYKGY
jgi:hypothetical protein